LTKIKIVLKFLAQLSFQHEFLKKKCFVIVEKFSGKEKKCGAEQNIWFCAYLFTLFLHFLLCSIFFIFSRKFVESYKVLRASKAMKKT